VAIHSMTAFARSQVRVNERLSYVLSLKGVNHRFLDLQLRMPSGLDTLEMDLRRVLKENLIRGHVDLTLQIDRQNQPRTGYNRELVATYVEAFRAAREEFSLTGEPDLNIIFRQSGIFDADARSNADEDLVALEASVREVITPLIEEFKSMRAREGASLEANLHATMDRLTTAVAGVAEIRPEVEARYQARLTERLNAAVGSTFDRQRVLEEIAVLVERSDVDEEMERLTTHIGHFREILSSDGEAGKKLDFLLQEMNREANTLLSKTGGAGGKGTRITELGLSMKSEIEKAREQVQNAE
jgi:uncharacterized protein (TIGR00255 family)